MFWSDLDRVTLAVGKNDLMIQTVDKPNTNPIGQDRETLTFKALLYLNVAVHAQVCRLFCVVYILLFSLVTPAIPNIFFGTMTLCYSGVPMYVCY